MRGEALHAEMLLRSLLAEHRDCTPARLAVADYMVERGDLDGALQWLRAAQADDAYGTLGFTLARLHVSRGDPAAARMALEATLVRQPRLLEAWLMLGDMCDVLGDTAGAVRARAPLDLPPPGAVVACARRAAGRGVGGGGLAGLLGAGGALMARERLS